MRETLADKKEEAGTKIWCPETETFQYQTVCDKKCRKKYKCTAFMDHIAPKLF